MGQGRPWSLWILKASAEKAVFLASSGKKQVSPLLAALPKNFGKSSGGPPGKILPTPMFLI